MPSTVISKSRMELPLALALPSGGSGMVVAERMKADICSRKDDLESPVKLQSMA